MLIQSSAPLLLCSSELQTFGPLVLWIHPILSSDIYESSFPPELCSYPALDFIQRSIFHPFYLELVPFRRIPVLIRKSIGALSSYPALEFVQTLHPDFTRTLPWTSSEIKGTYSAKKGCKRVKATCNVKPKVFVESEDDEDTIVQPISSEVPALNVPWPSTIVVGTPHSPKQQLFGPASLIAGSPPKVMATSGSPLEVVETPQAMSSTPAEEPAVIDTGDILIPSPNNPCHYCTQEKWPCATRLDRRTRAPCLSCVCCATKKIKCVPASMGSPPKRIRGKSTTQQTHSRTPSRAPSNALAASQSKAQTRSQSRGPSGTPAVPAVTTPKAQSRGRSKTITAPKTPAPASFYSVFKPAVPRPALDVPMPDLHSMAIAIRDGAARIALLEARVAEQDGKIDTLQRLHEGLRRKVMDRHPSFPLPDSPVNATFLLDQSVPLMEPPSPKVQPASVIEGLIFELSQIQPEGPQTSGKLWTQMIRATLSQNMILMIWMLR
ncbi:hypothetical protein BDR07DRAFT_1384588 [Suillus spraguei]|nr:hypothetical protein BDR07DRAFT_1384588 [Suillus spraguei]